MPPAAKKKPENISGTTKLRRRAEAEHSLHHPPEDSLLTELDSQRLIHELQVHQIELEMQNQELQQARDEIEAGLERYTNLYDFAPVGYFTLDPEGTVVQVNLYGARLLGVERLNLVNRRFGLFVRESDRSKFNAFLRAVFESRGNEICEVTLYKEDADPRPSRQQLGGKRPGTFTESFVQIEATAAEGEQTCRAVVVDITERKRNEESLRWLVEQKTLRTEELETITYISATMRQAKTVAVMIPLLVIQSINALKSQSGVLALLEGETLVFSAGIGIMDSISGMKLPKGDDFLWDIVRSGERKVLDDLSEHKQEIVKNSFFDQLTRGLRACIITPLKKDRSTIGLLILGYSEPIIFTVNQMRLVTAISDMAGSALQRMNATETLNKMAANRTRELESIYQITSAASESSDFNVAFERVLELILPAVKANAGAIFLLNEKTKKIEMIANENMPEELRQKTQNRDKASPEGWVFSNKKILLLPNSTFNPKVEWNINFAEGQFYAGLPMQVQDHVVGVLSIVKTGSQQLTAEEITLLSFIANHLGLIVQNVYLFKREEHHALLKERSRMARKLHDSIIQVLFSAGLFSNSALDAITNGDLEKVSSNLRQSSQLIQQALIEMRLMVYELRFEEAEAKGLVEALKHRLDLVEKRSGINVKLEIDELPVINTIIEDGLYRIIMEALNNVFKHAKAENLLITISSTENDLLAIIKDDGIGFDPILSAQKVGIGLSSMRERVQKLNGSMEAKSTPGDGTQITITIPIEQ